MTSLATRKTLIVAGLIALGFIITAGIVFGQGDDSQSNDSQPTSTAHQQVNISAVYMTMLNTGPAPQKLISASAANVDLVTVYRNPNFDSDGTSGLVLNPHERIELTSDTRFLMLYGVNQALLVGDTVAVELRFESGDEVAIQVPVKAVADNTAPPDVQVLDGFQLINAYAVPTAFGTQEDTFSASGFDWNLPAGFPLPRVPDDNPMTEEKFELGRYLFYDTRLSGNGTQACATCHLQALAFTDGLTVSVGSTNEMHPRNSMALVNVAYNPTYTWANSVLTRIERQILGPMFGEFPIELGMTGHEDEILARFRADATYQDLFAAAFPDEDDPITIATIQKAISTFVRALISGNSAYDSYVFQDDKTALSESAVRGMNLFFGEKFECHHCHGGFNFTDSTVHSASVFLETPFHNTGLYNVDGAGAYPSPNRGLYEITGEADDMGKFRAPTLRNIALTAPYMHDGSIATLEEVITFYSNGGRLIETGENAGDGRLNPFKDSFVSGFDLSAQDATDLIHFLESLTDEEFITNPRFSDPLAGDQAN